MPLTSDMELTSWQVGDSSEQNGSYKSSMTKQKQNLLDSRIQYMFEHLQLVPTDITIPLVNLCWDDSFAIVKNNKKAIVERGWAPFNRNLLLNKEIRATMIEKDVRDEKNAIWFQNNFFNLPMIILMKAMIIQLEQKNKHHHLLPN
jgi:hypothetical protein